MQNETKTIDCTPTWAGVLNWYLTVLQDGNEEGKKIAKKELANMAKVADKWVEHCNKVNSRVITVDGEETTIGEFIAANTAKDVEPISNKEIEELKDMRIGELYLIGFSVITRIS